VLHARNTAARFKMPSTRFAEPRLFIGDVSTIAAPEASQNRRMRLAALMPLFITSPVGYREPRRVETSDGLPQVFGHECFLAPYILTALMRRPQRLIYPEFRPSSQHNCATRRRPLATRRWDGTKAYSETKLYDTMLAFAIAPLARRFLNALEPGWVPTKMGGAEAPDDINQAHLHASVGSRERRRAGDGTVFLSQQAARAEPSSRGLQSSGTN